MRLEDVCFSYGDKPVLQHVSLLLPPRGVTCLFGPSGCGKTTLMRLMLGLEQPLSGEIEGYFDKPAAVFQEDRLLPWKTALENAALPRIPRDKAAEALLSVGLSREDLTRLPRELSGGMQRRVAIARALAAESDALFLDEPFTGIDGDNRARIAALIRTYGVHRPVVLITHLPEEIALLQAERIDLVTL